MTSNYSRNYCQILQKEYIKDDSAQIMWRLLSSKLTNFKEIVDYKESILFSKVSHMSKKIMKKIWRMSASHSQSSLWNWFCGFFFPLMFFTICTMDFAEKKELFIVWQLDQWKQTKEA